MKYLKLLGVALMLFCINMKAHAGITVQEKKFKLLRQFEITMPKYSYTKNNKTNQQGTDKRSGLNFSESQRISRELINPVNVVFAGEEFVVREYRVNGKISSAEEIEEFEEFLDLQNTVLLGLEVIRLRDDPYTKDDDYYRQKRSERAALWKNSKADEGIPLSGCMTYEEIYLLTHVFDLDYSDVHTFLVFQRK